MSLLKKTLLFLSLFATGCSTIKKPFFWEIEKDGKQSYLLGTLHAGVEFKELPKIVHEKMDAAKIVFLETDMGYYTSPGTSLESVKPNFLVEQKKQFEENLKKKKSVKSYFSPEEWQEIVEQMKRQKVSPESAEFYPLQWINTYVTQREKTYVNFAQYKAAKAKSMDSTIERLAMNEGKTVLPLDTPERMTPECWDLLMVESIKYKLNNNTFERIDDLHGSAKDYKSGDAELFLKNRRKRKNQLISCLLKDRNKIWVEKIDNYHKKEALLFVAGGVSHFIDENNVLEMLQNIGYKVNRYPTEP